MGQDVFHNFNALCEETGRIMRGCEDDVKSEVFVRTRKYLVHRFSHVMTRKNEESTTAGSLHYNAN